MSYRVRSGILNDICLPVTVTYETESFQINKAWIGGAFALGLAFGILVTVFCVPVCIRDYFKKRKGCKDSLKEWAFKHSTIIIGVGIGIAVLEIFSIVWACCFCRNIGKDD
ncbi:Hypothetical predicted protein [Mytilus galloprovincialis]|uniref:Uncharacterized protein n=1 Tax=Mytilus galloprovincialis TaxID=29158 RepID=A0A8B6GRP8_MYTGA|nr:Hypothetical predicted protein [Mytilus galloprovincialis]